MTRTKTLIALFVFLSAAAIAVAPAREKEPVLNVNGCAMLRSPAKFNGKLVSLEGVAYGAFESFSMSFDCPGYVNLEQSLNANDIRKFGFLTADNDQMKKLNTSLFPNHDIMARENHTAHVRLIGRFRCHYDFPDCTNISVHGDSSIVIRSVLLVSNGVGSTADARQKE